MRNTIIGLMVALFLISTLMLSASSQESQKLPYVTLTGPDSKIKDKEYVMAQDKDSWAKLWRRHLGKGAEKSYNFFYNPDSLPVVDFAQCVVVAVFQGSRWNSAGLRACSITERGDAVVFRFDDKAYQTSGPDGGGVRATAYGFFIIPRTDKQIILEENVQGLIGKPPKWKERARLNL